MAVAFVLDFPTLTPEQATALVAALDTAGRPAAGQLLHADGPFGGGVRVIDIWESEAAYQTFVETRLAPAFGQLGIPLEPPPVPQFFPVTNLLK
jgi:hypothetical protein